MDAIHYIEPVRQFAIAQIENRRPSMVLPVGSERGIRFKNSREVLIRIESNYTEEKFMSCPNVAIDAMLIDAAKSDWWYNHEKQYEDRDYGEVEQEGSNDED